jgi:mannosylglycoprotein endo-beta-mannosidase
LISWPPKRAFSCRLQLLDENKKLITDNTYWIPDSKGEFSGLQKMKAQELSVKARYLKPGRVEVTLVNKENNVLAFFNRVSLIDADSKTRILPAFYSDNYVTVLPGEEKKLIIDYNAPASKKKLEVSINGWNDSNIPRTISIDE